MTYAEPFLRAYSDRVLAEIQELRATLGPERVHVQFISRIKSVTSTGEKLFSLAEAQAPSWKTFDLLRLLRYVPDLIGLRIITRYPDLVPVVAQHLLAHPLLELAEGEPHAYNTRTRSVNWYKWGPTGLDRASVELSSLPDSDIAIPVLHKPSGYSSVHLLMRHRFPRDMSPVSWTVS
jgi:ppGpp synthetase/RelA/SpoT-type nucleotidyltranferase